MCFIACETNFLNQQICKKKSLWVCKIQFNFQRISEDVSWKELYDFIIVKESDQLVHFQLFKYNDNTMSSLFHHHDEFDN